MANPVRPPGDLTVHTEMSFQTWQVGSGKSPDSIVWGPENVSSQAIFRSWRPTYAKGSVVTLPGGTTFRKATPYTHESIQLVNSGNYSGVYRQNVIGPEYRASNESGREIGRMITSPYKLRGLNIPLDAKNEAVTKALNKIADQKVNLGENLATMRQTVGLFMGPAKALSNALHAARRQDSWKPLLHMSLRDIKQKGITTKAASDYLAYVYGLKPLAQDVFELIDLMKGKIADPLILSAKASARRTEEKSSGLPYPSLSYTDLKYVSAQGSYKVSCSVWARIDPNTSGLRSLNQLGLLNPLGLAWDLVPYSFVVDWFLPVGPVLYALSAPAGLIFIDGSISMRSSETATAELRTASSFYLWNPSSTKPGTEVLMTPSTKYEGYVRSTLSSWPIPGLWIDYDPFRADRPLKALALSIMALSGSRPPVR